MVSVSFRVLPYSKDRAVFSTLNQWLTISKRQLNLIPRGKEGSMLFDGLSLPFPAAVQFHL